MHACERQRERESSSSSSRLYSSVLRSHLYPWATPYLKATIIVGGNLCQAGINFSDVCCLNDVLMAH